jgi:DNA-binding response OmpR family regulator
METQEALNPVRILIVDDHPNTASMLARVLARFDTPVEVITAASGEEALATIDRQTVDVLITDFMMPGLNGLELIERLKGEKKPAHIILITAYDTPGLALTARRLNVQDYLVKPVQPEKIRLIVGAVIEELRPRQKAAVETEGNYTARILVADDYPDNLRLLSTRLDHEGYEFIPAWDGDETLRLAREAKPDLLLLDINMPSKDGFSVLAEMRADPELAHIPVIVITAARIGPKDVREGLNLGADDYVIKPFDWRELGARIRSKLRVKQAEDQLRQRARELSILPEVGRELSLHCDIHAAAETVIRRAAQGLGASLARLDVLLPDGRALTKAYRNGRGEIVTEETDLDRVRRWGLIEPVLSARQGVVVDDLELDERWKGAKEPEDRCAAAVPLISRTEAVGVLTLTRSQPGAFTPEHCTLLQALACQAATAIQNALLYDNLRMASDVLRDPIMAVLGYNDMIAQAGPLNPMQQEFTRRIRTSAMQMRDLVSNLLETSSLG